MLAEKTVLPKPLAKYAALDYLDKHKQATAKELALDLDSRAATALELLERCTSQHLAERDEKERPRVYRLTGQGRERLEFFRSQDVQQILPAKTSNPSSRNPSASNPGSTQEDQAEHESVDVEAIKQEVRFQLEKLREDMRDFVEALGFRPSRGKESPDVPSQVEKLGARLERLAQKSKEALASEAIVKLYRAAHALTDPDSRLIDAVPTEEDVAALNGQVGEEATEKIERLVQLENELESARCTACYTEVLLLRRQLNLPDDLVRKEKKRWFDRTGHKSKGGSVS